MIRNPAALSIALLLAGGLAATPALAEEAVTVDAREQSATNGLSLQLSPVNWDKVIAELNGDQPAPADALQLPEQPFAANGNIFIAQAGEASGTADPSGQPAGAAAPARQPSGTLDAAEVARQSNNPLGGEFILWLNFFDIAQQNGDISNEARNSYIHLWQPVIPFRIPQIGEHWIYVNRPTIPTTIDIELPVSPDSSRPDHFRFDNKGGFGDVEYFGLLGTSTPTKTGLATVLGEGDAVLAGGFTSRFPTGKGSLTERVYAAGPAATAAFIGKDWTIATLVQHWWDYGKAGSGVDDFNFTRLQLFYYKSLPGAWQIGGSPIITADWTESDNDRWTAPIGLGAFKTLDFGPVKLKLGAEFRPAIISPDRIGNDWEIEFSVIPVTRNYFAKMLE